MNVFYFFEYILVIGGEISYIFKTSLTLTIFVLTGRGLSPAKCNFLSYIPHYYSTILSNLFNLNNNLYQFIYLFIFNRNPVRAKKLYLGSAAVIACVSVAIALNQKFVPTYVERVVFFLRKLYYRLN